MRVMIDFDVGGEFERIMSCSFRYPGRGLDGIEWIVG